MSIRTVIVLALAIVCGASATFGVVLLQGGRTRPDVEKIDVVVAVRDIVRGQLIAENDVSVRQWPKNAYLPNAITDRKSVTGRTSLVSIGAGEPILESRLADRDAGRGLAALIPEGMRAYTIHTARDASNVAGFVLPGNRVDVLLTLRGSSHDATGGGSSTTLLQAVEILAVDQRLDAPAENRVDPKQLRSVTLLVSPDQAALLDLGQNTGTLTLALRNPEDRDEALAQPATVNSLRYTQREPIDTPTEQVDVGWLKRPFQWLASSAIAFPLGINSLSGSANTEKKQREYYEIRTLRGRHVGRVMVSNQYP